MNKKLERADILNKIRVRNFRMHCKRKNSCSQESTSDIKISYKSQISDSEERLSETEFYDANVKKQLSESTTNEFHAADIESDESRILSESESDYDFSDTKSDDESDCEIIHSKLSEDLKKWTVENNIYEKKLDSLLRILKPYHPQLPLSSKTLLKSNMNLRQQIKKFDPDDVTSDAEFIYFGIADNLRRFVRPEIHLDNILRLQFNVDGLPIFRSSSKEFWPILGKIYKPHCIYKPFIIAIYCGKSKPKSVEKFLNDFVTELNDLLKNGVIINHRNFQLIIMCFICDRPARSFLKCIKSHTAYYGCERCTEKGIYLKHRVLYQSTDSTLRDNNSFRSMENVQHHNGISPLTLIEPPIDMVYDFVLDFMHLGYLGVTKKLLNDYWLNTSNTKLSRQQILQISQRLMNLSDQIPCEFQRTTRSLGEINKWKATEFRFFLLYCGPFVLKDILPEQLYKHFMLLHVSCRILCSEEMCKKYLANVKIYLQRFVILSQQLYGMESQVLNIHSLIHLVDDVKNMNCSLSEFSAFPFESTLGQIKKDLRSGNKPLIQICKRIEEKYVIDDVKVPMISKFEILKSRQIDDQLLIQRIRYNNCILTAREPNNTVLLKNNILVKIKKMFLLSSKDVNKIHIIGQELQINNDHLAFDYPSNSSILKVFSVKEDDKIKEIEFNLSEIECKVILLKIYELTTDEKDFYAIPLLHINESAELCNE